MNTGTHDSPSQQRLLVRVLQDVVNRETFTSYADLAEAFKQRCAQLHLRYDAGLTSAVIDQLERGGQTPLIHVARRESHVERETTPFTLPHADAVAVLAQLGATVPTMPTTKRTAAEHDAILRHQVQQEQRKAYQAERRRRPLRERLEAIFITID